METLVFEQTTDAITVSVRPIYLPHESEPKANYYVWAYQVRLENHGTETVQLLNRHWKITDGNGMTHEVHGEGVVGKQPLLKPGDVFEYASGTHLGTSSGVMRGSYEMQTLDGEQIMVRIPIFSLDSPEQLAKPN